MTRRTAALALVVVCLAPAALARTPRRETSAAQSLPLRRVILYSNGVAYFERRGTVTGRAEVALPFKQSQVDDVLKSMVVLDLGHGRVGSVSYNSSAPTSARLAEIPFSVEAESKADEDGSGGLAAVLRQLQGARVAVTSARGSAVGAILTVERRETPAGPNQPREVTNALVVATDAGEIASFDLGEVRSVRLVDEGSRHDVSAFANASASARRRDAKTIVVTSDGAGAREMVVSYTVAAPIWKTSYRVVFDASGQPFFQGWAIVDNTGDEDWNDVALSLVSGSPVSFIQPLQQPLYRYRPVIPIPEDLALTPQTYEPEVAYGVAGGVPGGVAGGVPGGVPGGAAGHGGLEPPKPPPPPVETTLSDAVASEDSGVETAATGAEVGDLFEYSVDAPVTVLRDRSALIPIVQTRLDGERVSIYNRAARADRPMSGVRLKNSSRLTFEGGPLTVFDGNAYAGEALMDRLKPGEERFVTYALDLGTLVTTDSDTGREPVFLVRALNGVFQAHYYETESLTYTLTNQTDRPRTVYVEHPKREGWRLAPGAPEPAEQSESFYRFRVELGPHETERLEVGERRALMDAYQLSSLTANDVELFVSRRYVDEATRTALAHIVDLKREIAATDVRIATLDAETREIGADQARLRENIKALGETAEARSLIARYVAKAGEQETRLEAIVGERKAALADRARLQADVDAAIRAFKVDKN